MKLKFSVLTLLVVTALGAMAGPNLVGNPEETAARNPKTLKVKVTGTDDWIDVAVKDGYVFLGDMRLKPVKAAQSEGIVLTESKDKDWRQESVIQSKQIAADNHLARATRWPNNTVYYTYDAQLSQTARNAIQEGMKLISDKTAVRFVQRTNETNYVRFFRGDGCYSDVGMQRGGQDISIGSGCEWPGIAAHEMLHALGWMHEQMRPDRDSYVQIHEENMQTEDWVKGQFIKLRSSESDPVGGYDFDSVMHYSAGAFSKNGQATIVPVRSDVDARRMGQRKDLSPGDVASVQKFYPGDVGQVTLKATFNAQQLTIDENGSGSLTLDLAGTNLTGIRVYPSSDNTSVIASTGISVQENQTNQRTVRITPVRGAFGTANITVRIIATNGKEATASFKLTVLKDKNGGGTGGGAGSTTSKYDRSGKYKHGDVVEVNGKRYTLTLMVNNQPGGTYWIWGSYCDPTSCSTNNSFKHGGWLNAYWASAGSGGGSTGGGTTTNADTFNIFKQYRDQDQTVYKGRTYRLTVKVDGRNTNNYPLYGGSCIPTEVPFVSKDGRATAYWQ
ncbi:M12 family metallopeptidase [Chitinimonas sp. BJB300]|uniref:M12 family metallopeptidase n=1 Tax=Chitinimonas sp. BJB300 TaxID=1559339 RepID=UPI000C0DC867|nr:M12 family metallopeptidase [Chitinimonas sp. BJB300]PHV09900.1 hypothetical protein CSQ89_19130 [Chitinimonas sp. BJB300]TSJ83819.1 hypothetical protein FG002_020725 [Chitinimonas sp. BJB300]